MGTETINLEKYKKLYDAIKPVAEDNGLTQFGQNAKDKLQVFATAIKQAVGYMSKSDWDGSVQKEIQKSVDSISKLALAEEQSAELIIGATGPISIMMTAIEQLIDAAQAYEGYVDKVAKIKRKNDNEKNQREEDKKAGKEVDESNVTDNGLAAAQQAMKQTLELALKCQEEAEAHIANVRNYFNYDFNKHESKDYNPNLPFVSYITDANKDLVAAGLEAYKQIDVNVDTNKEQEVQVTQDSESSKDETTTGSSTSTAGETQKTEENEKGSENPSEEPTTEQNTEEVQKTTEDEESSEDKTEIETEQVTEGGTLLTPENEQDSESGSELGSELGSESGENADTVPAAGDPNVTQPEGEEPNAEPPQEPESDESATGVATDTGSTLPTDTNAGLSAEDMVVKDAPTTINYAYDKDGNRYLYVLNEDEGKYLVAGKDGVVQHVDLDDFDNNYYYDENVSSLSEIENASDGDLILSSVIPDDPSKNPFNSSKALSHDYVVAASPEEANAQFEVNKQAYSDGEFDKIKNIVFRGATEFDDGNNQEISYFDNTCLRVERNADGDLVYQGVNTNGSENDLKFDANVQADSSYFADGNDASSTPNGFTSSSNLHAGKNQTLAVCEDDAKFENSVKNENIIKIPQGTSINLTDDYSITAKDKDLYMVIDNRGRYVPLDVSSGSTGSFDDSSGYNEGISFRWDNETNSFDVEGDNG